MLRNSAYTRGSMTPSDITPTATNPQADHHFGAPPASSRKALAKLEAMQQDHESSSKSASMVTSTSASSVQPDVFDELTKIYDDPSVVRYCQNVREVTAATPARIIAQISSDSFMDYELVSDFFLTFRSYLSTYSVLDLLLARLRWAIGRLEDDGRIIRVRTFAALRHWILNYFMDDFFVDRRLRVRFCSEVNRLYADVKARPENGFSDLKLLRDLKRCWNGRCSLCWNPEDFELDGEQEEDIKPGGMIDAESTPMPRVGRHTSEIRLEVPQIEVLRGPSSSWFEADFTAQPRHRQQTSMSDYTSESLRSDGSVQANSCFVPMSLLRPSGDNDAYSKGPHPISVQLRRKNAPANLQVVTQPTQATKALGHRKGASSIDSNREPTPRTIKAQAQANVMEDGNIIRGLLYSPRAPFVQIISSNSTQSLDRSEAGVIRGISRREPGTQSTAQPGGRNIFGSLRKVLGSKHGQIDMALLTISQPVKEVPTQGNRSLLPLSVSKSHDELKAKVGRSMARKGEIRIDLLCAAVCQNYETKFPTKHRITYGALLASHPPLQPIHSAEGGLKTPRMASHATAQSGSILIVDDTGLDVHSMSGALHMNEDDMDRPQPRPAPLLDVPTLGSKAAFYDRNGSIDAITTQRSSDVLGDGIDLLSVHGSNDSLEPATFGANHANRSCEDVVGADYAEERIPSRTTASSRTVRDGNVSFDIPRPVSEGLQGDDSDPQPAPAESQELNEEEAEPETDDKLPKHTLRRRPGGDLRRVENVQQLDHTGQHQSLDTASAASYSPQGSLLIMKTENRNRRASADGPPTNKPISMINTHSSQHLRPSFEAAVAGFSAIPDDDDGGLEATLMKLEGRYEKKSPPLDQHPLDTTGKRRSLPDLNLRSQSHLAEPDEPISLGKSVTTSMGLQIRETAREIRPEASQDEVPTEHGTGHGVAVEMEPLSSRSSSIFGLPTESVAGSEESYGSLPLLKRETAYESVGQPLPLEPGAQPELIAPGYFAQDPPQLFHLPKGPPPSARKNRNSLPRPDTANESNHSFLLDEDENLSDLSSEISVDVIDYAGIGGRSVSPMLAAPGTAISGLEIPAHPLTYASVVNLNAPEVPFRISDPGPQSHSGGPNQSHGLHTSGEVPDFQDMPSHPLGHLPAGPAHIPFVLACDSQNLAQQMTLVEKSALCEVEWSDLVEMRWDHKAADILDWVDCLTTGTIRGIDLVITRFNLVVKWALSEIVLTHDIHERARVITKYIHVAAHARRLHNYATMLQLTIALTSIDCTRLSKTWELVSSPDRSLLKHMEALVQPIRNFHDLRLEMESADLSDGCVPFIGRLPYLQDTDPTNDFRPLCPRSDL